MIFDEMTWSFSRISSFESCPYKFYLTYVRPQVELPLFFSSFGSLMHEILEGFYSGKLDRNSLATEYLTRFYSSVPANAPSSKVFSSYFKDGLRYLNFFTPLQGTPLAVEQHEEFDVLGCKMQGYPDLVLEQDDMITLVDHKSRALKPRSSRKKPTKGDEELDRYLRQLYLYSIPLSKRFGKPPDFLAFNCYRTGEVIVEPYKEAACKEAKAWVKDTVDAIKQTKEWEPKMEYCRCHYLCGVNHACEYYEMYMNGGGKPQ